MLKLNTQAGIRLIREELKQTQQFFRHCSVLLHATKTIREINIVACFNTAQNCHRCTMLECAPYKYWGMPIICIFRDVYLLSWHNIRIHHIVFLQSCWLPRLHFCFYDLVSGQGPVEGSEVKSAPYFTARPVRQRTAKRQPNPSAGRRTNQQPGGDNSDIRKYVDQEMRDIQQLRETLGAELAEVQLHASTG